MADTDLNLFGRFFGFKLSLRKVLGSSDNDDYNTQWAKERKTMGI